MLRICLAFWKSEPQYAYKRYAYKKKHVYSMHTTAHLLGRIKTPLHTLTHNNPCYIFI